MALSAQEKLRRFYAVFKGDDQVLIVINADPDAIASAMGVKRLLWRKVSGIVITNINIIKRPDNLAMIRLLGVQLVYIEKIDPSRFSRIIMVDSQPEHNKAFSQLAPHVVIDHHPATACNAAFLDIRPTYGATATIITEYLRAAAIKPSVKLATGLFHAIKTDTSNFERPALVEDIRAFQFLYQHANIQLAKKIEHDEIRLDFLKYYRIALENMRIRKGRVFAYLGPVATPDICVLIADFFMRVHQINYSIVSGIYEGVLVIIFRNDGLRASAGNLAKQSFGPFGSAGGHKSMARAELNVANLPEGVAAWNNKVLFKWIVDQIEYKGGKKPPREKKKSTAGDS
ncbi:MAG: DHH family phosphoesterase [Desulfobacterales bacterium]|jgi:nanoRNase/pAp phosphatase (c-di-AMP/oligoRNAs hydrolase)|nr:DHH family phosphoesterase [Desulfobacterales bacterium]